MKTVKAFQCSFCTFYRKTKKSVIAHEDICFKNPKNKACASCKNNDVDYETVYNRYHGGDPGSTDYEARYNYCTEFDVVLNSKTLRKNCPRHSKVD
jgi:hypothetical protein